MAVNVLAGCPPIECQKVTVTGPAALGLEVSLAAVPQPVTSKARTRRATRNFGNIRLEIRFENSIINPLSYFKNAAGLTATRLKSSRSLLLSPVHRRVIHLPYYPSLCLPLSFRFSPVSCPSLVILFLPCHLVSPLLARPFLVTPCLHFSLHVSFLSSWVIENASAFHCPRCQPFDQLFLPQHNG